jgi:hypothetical protein
MKIQLERNLKPHHRLRCLACQQSFSGVKSRMLLYRQDRSLVGDVCKECLDRGNNHIQQCFKHRAIALIKQPLTAQISPSPHKQALELWELANEHLQTPSVYDWWWQRSTIFVAKIPKWIGGRRGKMNYGGYRPVNSQQMNFPNEEESSSIGKDN